MALYSLMLYIQAIQMVFREAHILSNAVTKYTTVHEKVISANVRVPILQQNKRLKAALVGTKAKGLFTTKNTTSTTPCILRYASISHISHFFLLIFVDNFVLHSHRAWQGVTCSFSVTCDIINQSSCLAGSHVLLHSAMCCCQSMIFSA